MSTHIQYTHAHKHEVDGGVRGLQILIGLTETVMRDVSCFRVLLHCLAAKRVDHPEGVCVCVSMDEIYYLYFFELTRWLHCR